MAEHIIGVDHLLIDSDDLEADRLVWQRLGFNMTPRGRHPQWGTGNYCAMLRQGYLELIGVVDPEEFTANAARRGSRRQGNGLSAIALATDNAHGAKAELTAAGVASDGPKNLSRLLEAVDGTSEPRFDILHLPGDASPAIPMFLCGHRTPNLVRRPGWTDHPNGARALISIAVPVVDPPACVEAYSRLLGPGAVTLTDDIVTLRVGAMAIVLARHGDLASQYPDLLPDPGGEPCPGVVTLSVKDPSLTAEYLSGSNIPLMRDRQSIMIAAEDACGIAMVFEKT
jgi:hypothetical protein